MPDTLLAPGDKRGASAQHSSPLQQLLSILPHRASLVPKNSLGALLLDFRASLQAPYESHFTRDSNKDLEDVLQQLNAAHSGDLNALDQELEAVSVCTFSHAHSKAYGTRMHAKEGI